MRIKKGTYLLIGLLLVSATGMAQLSVPFSMAPIASSGGVAVASGGNPIVLGGAGKCLNVSSGISTININSNNKGVFGASCVETAPVATIVSLSSVKVYPNPTHGMSILKCEGQFDANLFGQVRVTSIDGKPMLSQLVSMRDVVAGYQINANNYAAGNYVVTLDFMDQRYSVKLIKL